MDPRIAIVGGGVSGLAAAYELTNLRIPFVLFERAPLCGGVVVTEQIDGYTIDAGPDALLTHKPAAIALCHEVEVGDRLRPQLTRTTYVVRRGRLRLLPEASVFGIPTRWSSFVTSGAFSWHGKLRMAAEFSIPPQAEADDESIGSFIGRRFGREAVEYLAEPLLAGIHGGDPSRLSMRAAFPRFLDLERRSGSVIRGLRAAPAPPSLAPPFAALPTGMQELTAALVNHVPAHAIHSGVGVRAMAERHGEYVLELNDGKRLTVPAVLIATPPAVAARLLQPVDTELSRSCAQVRAASVVTVALGYVRSAVRHALNGTGVLIPRREGFRARAVSWVSSKWADRAPADRALLRASIGGITDPAAIDLDDATLVAIAHHDAARLLGINAGPELTRVYRWRDATPQLEVGHLALMDRIEQRLRARPGVFLSASGFRGTGIADCVADARAQARRAAASVPAATSARL